MPRVRIELFEPGNTARYAPPNPNFFIGHHGWDKHHLSTRDSIGSVIFVPSPPVGQTIETLQSAFPLVRTSTKSVIAVTDLPETIEHNLQRMRQERVWADSLLFDGTNQHPPLDVAFSNRHYNLTNNIIFLREGHRNGALVGEILRKKFKVKDIKILPNTHIGFEGVAAEVGQYFGLNYPSPEVVRELETKSGFHKLQRSLGLRTPEQSPIILTAREGQNEAALQAQFGETPVIIADTNRQAKAEILAQIPRIGEGKDKVVIKAVDGYGSVSVYILARRLSLEEREKLVTKHLEDRNGFGRDSSIVEEYMDGEEVGCHITTSGGKVVIKYTRKTMSTAIKSDQSEEVEHVINPRDPIFELCDRVLTPKIMRILHAKDLQYCNATHNVDAKLDLRYFDDGQVKAQPPEIAEDDDNSYLSEWNVRKGGTVIEKLIAKATDQDDYPQWEILATMGESDAIDAMNAAEYKQAGIIHTDLWDISGHAINARNAKGISIVPGRMKFLLWRTFYEGLHTFDTTYKAPGVFDTIKRLRPVGDYLTKGQRPIFGVWGKNIEEARQTLTEVKAHDGIIMLRGGVLYVNSMRGGYERFDVDPKSRFATALSERGVVYRSGRWVLAS
ncbi:MAG TPA: hypothetical protein VLF93_01135 [Candidatus Saccharimonadales bacterium]|nr:hypothetical protein [Candidatus Saccharimonadales bacterium]